MVAFTKTIACIPFQIMKLIYSNLTYTIYPINHTISVEIYILQVTIKLQLIRVV